MTKEECIEKIVFLWREGRLQNDVYDCHDAIERANNIYYLTNDFDKNLLSFILSLIVSGRRAVWDEILSNWEYFHHHLEEIYLDGNKDVVDFANFPDPYPGYFKELGQYANEEIEEPFPLPAADIVPALIKYEEKQRQRIRELEAALEEREPQIAQLAKEVVFDMLRIYADAFTPLSLFFREMGWDDELEEIIEWKEGNVVQKGRKAATRKPRITQKGQKATDEEADKKKKVAECIKGCFFGEISAAENFVNEISQMKPTQITALVNKLLAAEKISKLSCNRDLWKPLNEAGLYRPSESNWNKQIQIPG